MNRYKDRVAIVTGAASGIGAEIASLLRIEGACVVATDLNGSKDGVAELDVRDLAAAISIADDTVREHGRIDALFNVAGIGLEGDVLANSDSEWMNVLSVNLMGVVNMCRAVLPIMRDQRSGAIVNTSSVVGIVGFRNRAAYSASKGAVSALTRAMAADHVGDGIRINAIAPGTVDTPWVRRLLQAAPDPAGRLDELRLRQPIGRLGSATEIARAALFLASSEADFAVGTEFVVDGGIVGLA